MNPFKSIEALYQYLEEIPKFQTSGVGSVNYSLDSIRGFCMEAGNIHKGFFSIHVAGTNGKGTTSSLIEWIYRNSGLKTGLFTSPHLLKYNERVKVNGEDIPDAYMLDFFNEYLPLISKYGLSFFEISTALAFWYFSLKKVDLAVIETGLGGRLDATNIIVPELSVITSISPDHTEILGDTIEKIASEKGGIIKEGKPVVIGDLPAEAQQVIEQISIEKKAELHVARDLYPVFKKGRVILNDGNAFSTSFIEEVNKWNVAMAVTTCSVLKKQFPVDEDILNQSIENFTSLPGRFEKLVTGADWYFTGAHNTEALVSSLGTVREISQNKEPNIILSLMKDKVSDEVISMLNDFNTIYYVTQDSSRAASLEDVRALKNLVPMNESNYASILNELKTSLVIFAGSFYFYPIVKRWISQIDQNN